jgi:hypothetical protein
VVLGGIRPDIPAISFMKRSADLHEAIQRPRRGFSPCSFLDTLQNNVHTTQNLFRIYGQARQYRMQRATKTKHHFNYQDHPVLLAARP